MRSTPSTVVQAAGALVWRVRQSRLQVALVHRPRYKDWSWPKGKLDPGEATVTAAWREVAEEFGHDVVLGVFELLRRQRTAQPVRARLGFRQIDAERLAHELLIADAGAETGERRGDLSVEEPRDAARKARR